MTGGAYELGESKTEDEKIANSEEDIRLRVQETHKRQNAVTLLTYLSDLKRNGVLLWVRQPSSAIQFIGQIRFNVTTGTTLLPSTALLNFPSI